MKPIDNTWRVFNHPALPLFFSTDGSLPTIDYVEVQISNVPIPPSLTWVVNLPDLSNSFPVSNPSQLALLFYLNDNPLPCFLTVFPEWNAISDISPSPMLFSLLEWYIIPLLNFNSSLYFLLLIQTIVFYLQLSFFSCFFPLNPWCKLSIGVLHCVPNLPLRKRSNGFPLNKTPM